MRDNSTFLILSVVVVVAVLAYLIVDLKDFIPKNASGSLVEGIENSFEGQKYDPVNKDESLKLLLQDDNFTSMMNDSNFIEIMNSPEFIELTKNPAFPELMKSDTFWEVIGNNEFHKIDSIFYSE